MFEVLVEKVREVTRDRRGLAPQIIVAIAITILFFILTFAFVWWFFANLETIGKGLLYLGGFFLEMVLVVLIGKYLYDKMFAKGGVRG